MFRKVIDALGLGNIFGKSVEPPAEVIEKSEFDYGVLTPMSLPELPDHTAPVLHVMTSKSAGIGRVVGETDEMVIQSDETGEDIVIPADEGQLEFPVNEMTRFFELGEYETFADLKRDIQTWQTDKNVARIGQQTVDEGASHIITIVPAEYSSDTSFERIKLDRTTGDSGWAYLEAKFNELKGKDPGPVLD